MSAVILKLFLQHTFVSTQLLRQQFSMEAYQSTTKQRNQSQSLKYLSWLLASFSSRSLRKLFAFMNFSHENGSEVFHINISAFFSAFQHGWQVSGAGLGQHPHGGDQTPRRRASGGAAANPLEESGEPHHWGSALLPPPTPLCCGPGVQWALLHHPRGSLVEEERYCTLSSHRKHDGWVRWYTTRDDQ